MSNFAKMLSIYCRVNNINTRGLAKEVGVSYATISRIMNGKPMSQTTFLKVLNWLFEQEGQE